MQFKTALKRYMKRNNLSANKVAKKFGVSRRMVVYWKSGEHQPPAKKREALMEKMLIS